ncbi:aminopeptidase P family protein [Roseofilum sp. BLCC_M154]|uniref:Xaa-Pro aminopeptidase n=1 Tax=Roseofilum acuticapitatum BLCC-M154 TaxID=3022444 RepID=A0ABT7AND3_9CYAN|nr:aminopeptidase P family protein [Roseofilum acuticapitatum]MDJ1168400.1 aminopeptidase P family protein [Roseofilum acuticapitatum BLCC-M154]
MILANLVRSRCSNLSEHIDCPVILWSGAPSPRNFPANIYPFRANSHFLYFAGLSIPRAAIRLYQGKLELFMDDPAPGSVLWHGPEPTGAQWAEQIGADAHYPWSALAERAKDAATLPVQDGVTRQQQEQILGRSLSPLQGKDLELARAVVELRLCQDEGALSEIREAVQVSVEAHLAGMRGTAQAKTEAQVRSLIESVFIAHEMTPAYSSIVTVHGEILHHDRSPHPLTPGDLLLVDAGAETLGGWASDITRTWPVNGRFSPTQRAVYEVVLAAHDRCIAQVQPGREYEEIHLEGALAMAEGLVDLGILIGNPESLVEQDAHALFFPHGIGHLLGLDVHDMEDLGDLAGYAPGRKRSDRFGLQFLRLNRPLKSGMVVTIEPGFYQVPAILNNPQFRAQYDSVVNWEKLSQFSDVRGIRIEDDVLVTDQGSEVLTVQLPTAPDQIEQAIVE